MRNWSKVSMIWAVQWCWCWCQSQACKGNMRDLGCAVVLVLVPATGIQGKHLCVDPLLHCTALVRCCIALIRCCIAHVLTRL